jgi:hypothetical protein
MFLQIDNQVSANQFHGITRNSLIYRLMARVTQGIYAGYLGVAHPALAACRQAGGHPGVAGAWHPWGTAGAAAAACL